MNESISDQQVLDVIQRAEQARQDLAIVRSVALLPEAWEHHVDFWIETLTSLTADGQRLQEEGIPPFEPSPALQQLLTTAELLFPPVQQFLDHPAIQPHLVEPVPGPQIAGPQIAGAQIADAQIADAQIADAQIADAQIAGAQATEEPPEPRPSEPVPIGGHRLPPLPYPYNALEPRIDEATMRLHHDKHHKSYVDGLNQAEKMMAQARTSGDYSLLRHWEREAAFNGAGHYLHTIFWNNMSPTGSAEPTGPIAEQLRKDFGDLSRFRRHFSAAAEAVEGGGWALLVWSPRAHRLEILQAEKHQNLSQWDVIPLLVLDVWEHAYYLKHQNNRKAYIADWWQLVNWPDVNQRFEHARQLVWPPT